MTLTDHRKLLELLIEKAPALREVGITCVDLGNVYFEVRGADPEPASDDDAQDDDEPDRGPYGGPSGARVLTKKRGS